MTILNLDNVKNRRFDGEPEGAEVERQKLFAVV
jgi:hypothetical protein